MELQTTPIFNGTESTHGRNPRQCDSLFVGMPDRDEAEKAFAALIGRGLNVRAIKVNEAAAGTDRPRRRPANVSA